MAKIYKLGNKFWLQNSNTYFTIDGIENNTYYGVIEDQDGVIKRMCYSFGQLADYVYIGALKEVK